MKYDYFVVKDGQHYTAIDRSGRPVIGEFYTQCAAFRGLEAYQAANEEALRHMAEAAQLMDGWAL